MNVRIDKIRLKASHQTPLLLLDLLMMVLILVNLGWLAFDTLFSSELLRQGLYRVFPRFTDYYGAQIHPNFIYYDLYCVYIFLTELSIRWLIALKRHTYHRWWFYPFIHWYDVLGCIPVGSFRWLRLLRVFSIVYRLERHNIIDISGTPPVRFVIKYVNVVMEEISNRVVVNVLTSVQDEIQEGTPVVNNIVDQVVRPRIPEVTDWLIARLSELSGKAYEGKKEELRVYINKAVLDAFARNDGVAELQRLPLVGDSVSKVVEDAVGQLIYDLTEYIVGDVTEHMVGDVTNVDADALIRELTQTLSDKMATPPHKFREASRDMAIETLEVVKDQAKVQKWKLAEEAERIERRSEVPSG